MTVVVGILVAIIVILVGFCIFMYGALEREQEETDKLSGKLGHRPDIVGDTQRFNQKMGRLAPEGPLDPTKLTRTRREEMVENLREEVEEFSEALFLGDKVKALHELIDILYLAASYVTILGFKGKFRLGWGIVHRTNMTKMPSDIPGGKAIKPPDFKPADLSVLFPGEVR